MNLLKSLPIPICGLSLALISLGNFFINIHWQTVSIVFFSLASLIIFALLVKLAVIPSMVMQDMKKIVIASVSPTFTMTLMGIAKYLSNNPFFVQNHISTSIWYLAVFLHVVLMIYFTVRFVFSKNMNIQQILPSWFITYVGIGVITFTANAFNHSIGQFFLWLSILNYVILLPLIIKRTFFNPYDQEATFPLITIIGAPGSLILAGYLSLYTGEANSIFVLIFLVLSQGLYLISIFNLRFLLRLNFYPSFAAFTFPLVISGIACNLSANYLSIPFLHYISLVELSIAIIVSLFVLIKYAQFMYSVVYETTYNNEVAQ